MHLQLLSSIRSASNVSKLKEGKAIPGDAKKQIPLTRITKVPGHVVKVNLLTQDSTAIDITNTEHNSCNHFFDDLGGTSGIPSVIPG